MYYKGEGVAKNAEKAVHWWRKGAEQGSPDGQYNLGLMYHKGEGVTKNAKEAVKWWRKASKQTDLSPQNWAIVKVRFWG